MANGIMQRFKGRIAVAVGGVLQGGTPSQGVFTTNAAPTNGTSGTLANIATKGSLLSDTTNGALYYNTGTGASPTWSAVTIP